MLAGRYAYGVVRGNRTCPLASQPGTLPAAARDLISFLKALPDCRMRRGIRFPQWWMLLVVWRTAKREIKRGRDITWTLRDMPTPEWVMEQWPGSATITAVRSHATREGQPQDETRYYVSSLRTGAQALL